MKKCFCGGDGKYIDYNCGESFYVECPHCQGTGVQKCECEKVDVVCKTFGRGHEIVEPSSREYGQVDEDDDPHWMFID
jgi:hypothetical protein